MRAINSKHAVVPNLKPLKSISTIQDANQKNEKRAILLIYFFPFFIVIRIIVQRAAIIIIPSNWKIKMSLSVLKISWIRLRKRANIININIKGYLSKPFITSKRPIFLELGISFEFVMFFLSILNFILYK